MSGFVVAIGATVAIALTASAADAQQTDEAGRGNRRLADEISELPVGVPVRVNAGCAFCVQFRGPFVRATGDTLWLGTSKETNLAIPAREIVSLDILASGRWAGAARGMTLGFLAGGLLGAVIGAASADHPNSVFRAEASSILGFAIFGVAGAVVGGITGFVTRGERWLPLPPPRPPA